MARFCVVVPHSFMYTAAVERIKLFGRVEIFPDDRIKNLPEELKASDGRISLTVMRFLISADLGVDSTIVNISGNLPFLASLFKEKIEDKIRERVYALFHPTDSAGSS